MNFAEYFSLALRTAAPLPTKVDDFNHAALGLITEIGEFAGPVKRMSIYGKPMTDEFMANMREELGDAMWYIPVGLQALGVNDILPLLPESRLTMPQSLDELAKTLHVFSAGFIGCTSLQHEEQDFESAHHFLSALVHVIDDSAPRLLGVTGDWLREQNIEKLRKRYPDRYTAEAAEARADKGGLDARHS